MLASCAASYEKVQGKEGKVQGKEGKKGKIQGKEGKVQGKEGKVQGKEGKVFFLSNCFSDEPLVIFFKVKKILVFSVCFHVIVDVDHFKLQSFFLDFPPLCSKPISAYLLEIILALLKKHSRLTELLFGWAVNRKPV